MTCIAYVIDGDPVPKARPRVYGRRTITEPRTVAYEALVALHTVAALARARRAGVRWDPTARVEVQLVMHRATRRAVDVDNVGKAFLDGAQSKWDKRGRLLHQGLFDDDAQVDLLEVARGCVDRAHPRLVVLVRAMTVAESEAAAAAMEAMMLEEAT